MPAALPPTPWIQGSDPAGEYLKGYGIGQQGAIEAAQMAVAQQRIQQQAASEAAQINMAQQRLQQQAQIEATQLEVKKQQVEKEMMLDQHKLEIEKQYRESQIGMRKQQLDEAAKINNWKISQAASQAAAQMEATKRIQAGEDPSKVWMEVGLRAGVTGPALASLARTQELQKQAAMPPEPVQTAPVIGPQGIPLPGAYGVRSPTTGRMEVRNTQGFEKEGSVPQANAFWARKYEDDLKDVRSAWSRRGFTSEPPEDKVAKAKWLELKTQRDDLEAKIRALVPDSTAKAPAADTGTNEVTRRTKNGRLAVFDATTKKFIRYADE